MAAVMTMTSTGIHSLPHTPPSDMDPPPKAPNPSMDGGIIPRIASPAADIPSPPAEDEWDVYALSPETALKMLCRSVQGLVDITGDIPPTPPLTRPSTPYRAGFMHHRRRGSAASAVSNEDLATPAYKKVHIGSPEAHEKEPLSESTDVGHGAKPVPLQHEAIARKFFSKRAPPISIEEYVLRLQRYCPMSTAVYLAAGTYIYKLAVEDKSVPVTHRTAHRLVLACLRVAMKALEDLRYPQARFAGVGGVKESELCMLEISVCYLTNFELQADKETLYRRTCLLRQASLANAAFRPKLPSTFCPTLPIRDRTNQ